MVCHVTTLHSDILQHNIPGLSRSLLNLLANILLNEIGDKRVEVERLLALHHGDTRILHREA